MRLASCHGKNTFVAKLRKNTAQTLVGKLGVDLEYLCKHCLFVTLGYQSSDTVHRSTRLQA